MVQLLLGAVHDARIRLALWVASAVLLLIAPVWASRVKKMQEPAPPDLLMDGGRKLSFERSFSHDSEIRPNSGFWRKLAAAVAGQPACH